MGIEELISYKDNDGQEVFEVAEAPVAEAGEELVESAALVEPDVYGEMDEYDDDPVPTGGLVKVSIDVDPSTVTSKDIPKFGLRVLEGGLNQMFGEDHVDFVSSGPGENSWDILFSVNAASEAFHSLPALQSLGQALIRPRMVDGEIEGDMVNASTSAEFVYG